MYNILMRAVELNKRMQFPFRWSPSKCCHSTGKKQAILRVQGESYEVYKDALDLRRDREPDFRMSHQTEVEPVRAAVGIRQLIDLPDCEVAEIVACARAAAKRMAGQHGFATVLLPYLCSLPEKQHQSMYECDPLLFDLKRWSNINNCSCVGFKGDPGNSSFFFALHTLLLELSPIPSSCSRLASLRERNPWKWPDNKLEQLCNRCGDVLEAVGGICDPRSSDARTLRTFLENDNDITASDFVVIRDAQTRLAQQMFFAWKFARTDKGVNGYDL